MRRWLLLLLIAVPAFAAQYPPEYRWRTLTTEHFFIHHHTGEEELARRAASIAEQAHLRVTRFFGHQPSSRTHLVLADHVDVSNGSATPFPVNRMEVYVSAPGADPSTPLEHYDDWLQLVITHEYAHVVHLDQVRGFWRGVRNVFGRVPLTFPNAFSPLWMVEGIATVIESEETEAGRLKGTFLDMVLRTAAIENRFPTAAQASGFSEEWPSGNARYFYGAAFLSWLGRTRGAGKLAEYFQDYAGNVIPLRVNASSKAVYGESMGRLWSEWSAEAQRTYREQHERLRGAGLTSAQRLTSGGYETKYPLLSPDGTRLAYAHREAYGWPSLRIRDVASNREVGSIRTNSIAPLSWSADGKRIAFSQLEYARTFSLLSDVYIWDVERSDVQRLTRGARLKSPAFAPDGSIVAVENRAGRNRLVRVDAQGAATVIVEPDDERQFSDPNVSGDRIALAEWQRGRIDVVLYDLTGRRIANLTEAWPPSVNASPRFSPDGSTIWFSSDVTGISNLYSVQATGGTPQRRTNVYGGAFFPSTADGAALYFSDYSSRGFDVARAEAGNWPSVGREVPRSVLGATDRAAVAVPPPAANVSDASYTPLTSVLPRWWYPVLSGATSEGGGTSFRIGAGTSGADVLGFHQYQLEASVGGGDQEETSLQYAGVYVYDRWWPTLSLAGARYVDDDLDFGNDDVITRTVAQATLPFRRYRWQSAVTGGLLHENHRSDTFDGSLRGARGAVWFNSAREFPGSISPQNGITAQFDVEALGGAASLRQTRADLRGYVSPFRGRSRLRRHVVAARVLGGWTTGDRLRERDMKAGGTGLGGPLTFGINEFPVRGYSEGTLRGRNARGGSVEYRMPLWNIDRGPATVPIYFQRLLAAAFYDTATVTDPDRTISSYGVEAGLDFYLGFVLPSRLRLGIARRSTDGNVEFYGAVGSSF